MKSQILLLVHLLVFLGFIHLPPAIGDELKPASIDGEIKKLIELNQHIMIVDDEAALNALVMEKTARLKALLAGLRQQQSRKIVVTDDTDRMIFLQSRIRINQEKHNQLAVMRDKAELTKITLQQSMYQYFNFLVSAAKHYAQEEEVVEESRSRLGQGQQWVKAIELPQNEQDNRIYDELKTKFQELMDISTVYQDILQNIIDQPQQIVSDHWFNRISLLVAIDYLNQFSIVKPINRALFPVGIDVGGVVVSLLIIAIIYFSFPLLFKFTSWLIPKYLIDGNKESHQLIYLEVRKPVRSLLVFYGIDLATNAVFYKTDFRYAVEAGSYIIYCILFLWLLFKILDTVVLLQVQELSRVNKELRKELFDLGLQVGKALLFLVVLTLVLNHFGISVTAILSTLGIGGLAFALAAKDTLSNFFGGITILFDNLYRLGDWVAVGDVEGTVAEIGLRSTTIRTFDNALITIPNAQVSVSSVKNWDRRVVGRRIKMHIGVTYESKMDDIRQALEDIRKMLQEHPGIANPQEQSKIKQKRYFRLSSQEDVRGIKATQLVFMDRYNDFSIDILVYCFSKTVNWVEWLTVKEDVLFKIAQILRQNNLDFAYPTQVRINRQAV